jgi:hypothetical protein
MNPKDIRLSSDPDLAGSYDAMIRAARSAEDLAIITNTSIIVSMDGKKMRLSADELKILHKQEDDLDVVLTIPNT